MCSSMRKRKKVWAPKTHHVFKAFGGICMYALITRYTIPLTIFPQANIWFLFLFRVGQDELLLALAVSICL